MNYFTAFTLNIYYIMLLKLYVKADSEKKLSHCFNNCSTGGYSGRSYAGMAYNITYNIKKGSLNIKDLYLLYKTTILMHHHHHSIKKNIAFKRGK